MTEWMLLVFLYTANAERLDGYDWTMKTRGTYATQALCQAAAKVEQAKDVPAEGGRVVTCRTTSR